MANFRRAALIVVGLASALPASAIQFERLITDTILDRPYVTYDATTGIFRQVGTTSSTAEDPNTFLADYRHDFPQFGSNGYDLRDEIGGAGREVRWELELQLDSNGVYQQGTGSFSLAGRIDSDADNATRSANAPGGPLPDLMLPYQTLVSGAIDEFELTAGVLNGQTAVSYSFVGRAQQVAPGIGYILDGYAGGTFTGAIGTPGAVGGGVAPGDVFAESWESEGGNSAPGGHLGDFFTVPVPASVWLMSAMIGLFIRRRPKVAAAVVAG